MIKRVLTLALAAVPAIPVPAQGGIPASVVEEFKTMYPKTTFKEIRRSQVSEPYEVVVDENIAYTDESGRYFIFGHLFDMQQQVDLTAQRKLDNKKTKFPTQQLGRAIRVVRGDNSQILVMFSDPDYPYCKQLEGELARLDSATIYTFLYPLESLHPEAKAKAVGVWCVPSEAKAQNEPTLASKRPKLVACNNPVNDNLVLGSKLGVMSTPTLIAADGRVLSGSTPVEETGQQLDADEPGAPAAAQEATQ